MVASHLQVIALWPAELIVRLFLMLFRAELEALNPHWRVLIVGFVAFLFWGHIIKLAFTLIKRRVFGIYP